MTSEIKNPPPKEDFGDNYIGPSKEDGVLYPDAPVTESTSADSAEDWFIRGGGGDDMIAGGDGDDRLQGGSGDDRMWGGDGDDFMRSGKGDDTVKGGLGNDTMKGRGGDDYLTGEQGDDHLYGGKGDDYLDGDVGDDTLFGGKGQDRLWGGRGNDELYGDRGNDVLRDEEGTNKVDGGDGMDTYVLKGSMADYVFTEGENGVITVTHSDSYSGADFETTLVNVEQVVFGNGQPGGGHHDGPPVFDPDNTVQIDDLFVDV